jgi:RimJ/RimL family protein N-acetyltransferase
MKTNNSNNIKLTPATMEDADLLFSWRNDPETRKASLSTRSIAFSDHIIWLSRFLKDESKKMYIARKGDGQPVGTVRVEKIDGRYELSWTVAPEARGNGMGKTMVAKMARMMSNPITAKIKQNNPASVRIAEHAGMTLIQRKNSILYYQSPV